MHDNGHVARHVPRVDVEPLLAQTQSARARDRARAVSELCPCAVRYNDDRIWARLFAMTRDTDAAVRRQVVHALADGSPNALHERVIATLQTLYDDPDRRLRRTVRQLLAQYRRTGRINVL